MKAFTFRDGSNIRDKFIFEKLIGEGASAKVYRVSRSKKNDGDNVKTSNLKHQQEILINDEKYAVKVIQKDRLNDHMLMRVEQEIKIQ